MSCGFPTVVPDVSWGQWWRIHWSRWGPWWFASDTPGRSNIGRFDLPDPNGTCYLADCLVAGAGEHAGRPAADPRRAQAEACARRLSQMALDRWHGKPLADFTDPTAIAHGAPPDIALVPRSEARRWAMNAQAAGFHGILYRLKNDPHRRRGLALFWEAGEHPAPGQPCPLRFPVGLRHELAGLFDDRPDDPLAA